jgi:2-methylcitrate dehydratase PrpD
LAESPATTPNHAGSSAASATDALVAHAAAVRFEQLPPAAVEAAKTFVLDSLGVGLSGTRVPLVRDLHTVAARWGSGAEARVWGTGERVPAATAAFLNGYQIHNQEWDCVHEPAVLHPMAVVLATLLAEAEQRGGVSGKELIRGCVIAVDVAATIGIAARGKLRFFRPAMCGALGATAGIAAMRGFPADTLRSALGLAYSQLSGTMQAHVEGSPMLPMQIGFNARAALAAADLAERGIRGPLDFLEGPFGYFALIDPQWNPAPFADLGRRWRATELSHKPFPSGRATHGGVDGLLTLAASHGFAPDDIAEARVIAPPLVIQLVDRSAKPDMLAAYARLCLPYVAATALLTGTVGVEDFDAHALQRPERLALARRIRVLHDGSAAPNTLAPQRVEVTLRSGATHALDLPAVLGAPGRPLGRERHLAKFRRACATATCPLGERRMEATIAAVDVLETLADVRSLVDLLVPAAEGSAT